MYKHVFLDLDDTLWDFHANTRSALDEIYKLRDLGRFFESFDQYFSIYTKRNYELWALYGQGHVTKDFLSFERFLHPLREVGAPDDDLARTISREYLEMLPTRTNLLPFAREILDYLKPKYSLTIVSNGFVEVQYRKLKSCNLEHYFSHVVLSESAGALKPDKQIFDYALALNCALASETIMIGDSYDADIVGAQNAGIDQIYLCAGENQLASTFTINELEELVEIL